MSQRGVVRDLRKTDNASQTGPPYAHLNVAGAWERLLRAIADLARSHTIGSIVTTTHGCAAALVDEHDLVLPVMDYEANVPDDVNRDFMPLVPSFEGTQTPDLPQGLNLARQLSAHANRRRSDHRRRVRQQHLVLPPAGLSRRPQALLDQPGFTGNGHPRRHAGVVGPSGIAVAPSTSKRSKRMSIPSSTVTYRHGKRRYETLARPTTKTIVPMRSALWGGRILTQ